MANFSAPGIRLHPEVFDSIQTPPIPTGEMGGAVSDGLPSYAKLEVIIAYLTAPSALNYDTVSDFLMTYKMYALEREVWYLLASRLLWAASVAARTGRESEVGKDVGTRAYVLIKMWIKNYFAADFAPNLELREAVAETLTLLSGCTEFVLVDHFSRILHHLRVEWDMQIAKYWMLEPDVAGNPDAAVPVGGAPVNVAELTGSATLLRTSPVMSGEIPIDADIAVPSILSSPQRRKPRAKISMLFKRKRDTEDKSEAVLHDKVDLLAMQLINEYHERERQESTPRQSHRAVDELSQLEQELDSQILSQAANNSNNSGTAPSASQMRSYSQSLLNAHFQRDRKVSQSTTNLSGDSFHNQHDFEPVGDTAHASAGAMQHLRQTTEELSTPTPSMYEEDIWTTPRRSLTSHFVGRNEKPESEPECGSLTRERLQPHVNDVEHDSDTTMEKLRESSSQNLTRDSLRVLKVTNPGTDDTQDPESPKRYIDRDQSVDSIILHNEKPAQEHEHVEHNDTNPMHNYKEPVEPAVDTPAEKDPSEPAVELGDTPSEAAMEQEEPAGFSIKPLPEDESVADESVANKPVVANGEAVAASEPASDAAAAAAVAATTSEESSVVSSPAIAAASNPVEELANGHEIDPELLTKEGTASSTETETPEGPFSPPDEFVSSDDESDESDYEKKLNDRRNNYSVDSLAGESGGTATIAHEQSMDTLNMQYMGLANTSADSEVELDMSVPYGPQAPSMENWGSVDYDQFDQVSYSGSSLSTLSTSTRSAFSYHSPSLPNYSQPSRHHKVMTETSISLLSEIDNSLLQPCAGYTPRDAARLKAIPDYRLEGDALLLTLQKLEGHGQSMTAPNSKETSVVPQNHTGIPRSSTIELYNEALESLEDHSRGGDATASLTPNGTAAAEMSGSSSRNRLAHRHFGIKQISGGSLVHEVSQLGIASNSKTSPPQPQTEFPMEVNTPRNQNYHHHDHTDEYQSHHQTSTPSSRANATAVTSAPPDITQSTSPGTPTNKAASVSRWAEAHLAQLADSIRQPDQPELPRPLQPTLHIGLPSATHAPFVLSYNARAVAEQMTYIEKEIAWQIGIDALVRMDWPRLDRPVTSWLQVVMDDPQLQSTALVSARFNLVCQWVQSEILLCPTPALQAQTIARFVHIAFESLRLQNFATMVQLVKGLCSPRVQAQLSDDVFKLLPAHDRETLERLESLTSPAQNYSKLRRAHNRISYSKGCVPFTAMFLTDIELTAEAASSNAEQEIHFGKYRVASQVVKSLSRCVQSGANYEIVTDPALLSKCLYLASLPGLSTPV